MTDESTNHDGTTFDGAGAVCEVSRTIGEEPPSRAVVRAVASLTNTPVTELRPLYDVLDPEHLDGVCGGDASDGLPCTVSFEYAGCRVTVTGQEVRVRLLGDPET